MADPDMLANPRDPRSLFAQFDFVPSATRTSAAAPLCVEGFIKTHASSNYVGDNYYTVCK